MNRIQNHSMTAPLNANHQSSNLFSWIKNNSFDLVDFNLKDRDRDGLVSYGYYSTKISSKVVGKDLRCYLQPLKIYNYLNYSLYFYRILALSSLSMQLYSNFNKTLCPSFESEISYTLVNANICCTLLVMLTLLQLYAFECFIMKAKRNLPSSFINLLTKLLNNNDLDKSSMCGIKDRIAFCYRSIKIINNRILFNKLKSLYVYSKSIQVAAFFLLFPISVINYYFFPKENTNFSDFNAFAVLICCYVLNMGECMQKTALYLYSVKANETIPKKNLELIKIFDAEDLHQELASFLVYIWNTSINDCIQNVIQDIHKIDGITFY